MIYKAIYLEPFSFNIPVPESDVVHVTNLIDESLFILFHAAFFVVKGLGNIFCSVAGCYAFWQSKRRLKEYFISI